MNDRRQSILDAAQGVILDKGYGAATIADIRAASGASTGSIYHAFGNKEGIALALAQRALDAWQAAVTAAQRASDAEGLIRATVEGLLAWGFDDPAGFAVLDRLRAAAERGDAGSEGGSPLFRLFDDGRLASGKALEQLAEAGAIRPVHWTLAQAMILGPAYEFLRAISQHPSPGPRGEAAAMLSDLAWRAVAPD